MANQLKPLNQLSKPEIQELMNACVSFDPEHVLGPEYKDSEVLSYSSPKFGWEWKKKEFETEIKVATSTGSIAEANKALEKKFAEAPEQAPESVPSRAKAATQAEVLEESQRAHEAATQKGIDETRKFLDQEEKRAARLKDLLKNKKVYVKVEEPKVEKDAQVESLKQQADANPKQFVKDTEEALKETPTIADLPKEEKEVAAKQAAVTTYEVVSGSSPIVQAAIISRVVSDPKVLETIVPDAGARKDLKSISDILTDTKTSQYELSKQLLNLGKLGGYRDIGDIRVELSDRALPGYREFDLNHGIVTPYSDLLAQQGSALGGLRGVAEGQIKSQLLKGAGSWLDGQIAKLTAEGAVSQLYNSGAVKFGLRSLGVAETSAWAAVPGSWAGRLIVGSGFGPVAGALQQFTGISLGVAKTAATKVMTKVVAGAGSELVGEAAGLAVPVPGLNVLLAAIGGYLASKIPLDKVRDYSAAILGGIFGLIALPFFGIGGALGVGLGTTIGSAALGGGLGGLTLGRIAGSIGNFFLALGGAFLTAVGIPILVILLIFPVVVALILFIINSGAYIVPPSPLNLPPGASIVSPYMSVSKVANPAGPFKNTDFPITVEYQVKITPTKGSLSKVRVSYSCSVIKRQGSVGCPATIPSVPSGLQIPNTISPASPYTFSYQQTYTAANFQDSFVTDVINVTADTPEQTSVEAAGSAGVKIGNPPDSCPNGWPVTGNYVITQTPGGSYSHSRIEAMDIATPLGIPVRTTHSGVAHVVRTSGPYKPVYVDITSNCGGVQFTSRYAHLLINSIAVADGQQVTMGQLLGSSGTDVPNNAHLHYEFIGLTMTPPYLPKAIRRACSSNTGSCGSIP